MCTCEYVDELKRIIRIKNTELAIFRDNIDEKDEKIAKMEAELAEFRRAKAAFRRVYLGMED